MPVKDVSVPSSLQPLRFQLMQTNQRCGAHKEYIMMMTYTTSSYPYDASILPGGKNGDWMCNRCRGHNFASKVDCYRCKLPRE
ncbi:unnamed protein product [Lactuca virosa]|uniref:RanBP2-type domain-containing protein n=1 Tax=Lactuca virosa TaxID=75947 RepID=A0AAU9MDR1_9ASTR|nr:unnamed protein product [Lactuca virosa]